MYSTIIASTPCSKIHQHSLYGLSLLLNAMQSLGMTELWITGNAKKKINVTGKIAKNAVHFPRSIFSTWIC